MTKANTTTLQAFAGVTTLQYFKPTVNGQYQNAVFIAEPTDVSAGLTVTTGIVPNTNPSNPYKNMGYFNISGGEPNTTASFVLWLRFDNVAKAIPHKFTVEFYEDVITEPIGARTPINITVSTNVSNFTATVKRLKNLQTIAFTVASDFYGNLKGLTAIKNTVLTGSSAFLGTLKGLKAMSETITFTSFSSLAMAGLKGLTALKNVGLKAGSNFVANLKALAKISPVFGGLSNFSATVKGMKTVGTALFAAASLFAMARLTAAPDFPIDETNQAKFQSVYAFTQMVKGYTGGLFTIRRLSDNATMLVSANFATRDIDKAAIFAWANGADVDIDLTNGIPNQLVGVVSGTTTTALKPTAASVAFIRSGVMYPLSAVFDEATATLTRDNNNGAVGCRINGGDTSHLSMATSGITTADRCEFTLMVSPTKRKSPTSGTGACISISPSSGGTGYTSSLTRPILVYIYGGGVTDTPATITPTISSGAITGFTITGGGSGYTTGTNTIPLWISDTTGSGCYALASASGGVITAASVVGSNNGSNYTAGTKVVVLGGNKVGLAQLYQTAGVITSGKIVNATSGFTSTPTFAIATNSSGTGATFTGTINVNGDLLGSDSRGEMLLAYGPSSANQVCLRMGGTTGTFNARRVANTESGTDQNGNAESYCINANSLQILTLNLRDTTDTGNMKLHTFSRKTNTVAYSTGNQNANLNAVFTNTTLKIGAGISTTGSSSATGTGNVTPDFVFGALIVSKTLTENERMVLHGRLRLKAEPHLNLSTTELNALFSERMDFRDVDANGLLMGKNGKLAYQFNKTTPFNGDSPNITYGATSTHLGLTGVKLNDELNEANTFKSVNSGTATESYWTNLNEGSVIFIGARDATGNSGQYASNLYDWFSIGTNNPPDQLPPAQPANVSFAFGGHHGQNRMDTKISDSFDINNMTGTTPIGEQTLSQAWVKYFQVTSNGQCLGFALLEAAITVNGTTYPAGTILGWDLVSSLINKYPQTVEAQKFTGANFNTPRNSDYVICQIGSYKNGATYDKTASQASRDANARTATTRNIAVPLVSTTVGGFDCTLATQIGTANNVHATAGSRHVKSMYLTNSKAFYGFLGFAERQWTPLEEKQLHANAFKLVA